MAMKDEDFVTRVFVASTHAPILFFSSNGMVYKMKAWRLPQGDPRTKGRALINLLPLQQGETITSVMALPENEQDWDKFDVMFATKSGHVRRNKLSDFVQVNRNGKIAMKPDEGDGIVEVQICSEDDDILLTTANGQCVRCRVTDVRVFKGRDSTGVRGVNLADGDSVIGMGVLRHVDVTTEEVAAYFKWDVASRGDIEVSEDDEAPAADAAVVPFERLSWLKTQEQFILTVTSNGLGKRASAYEYRVTNRGGKGLKAHKLTGDGRLVASFPVKDDEELLLVTDKGQLIRTGVSDIRIAGRATQGVILINVSEDEHVVASERLEALGGEADDNGGEASK
jgi:DNA gyrase subunit A